MFNPKVLKTGPSRGFDKPAADGGGFSSSRRFNKMFKQMLGKQARVKNPKGLDKARGLGQAKAAVAGKRNTRTPLAKYVDPVAAAMQHTVRNRSVEQARNAISATGRPGQGRHNPGSILRFVKGN